MPNPRYLSREGEPTVELLMKIYHAKKTYFSELKSFCQNEFIDERTLKKIQTVYLIGSHAEESGWDNDGSDIDLKLVVPNAIPENLFRYKRKVLDKMLCSSERKKDWIDLYFVREDYQVTAPRYDLTKHWNQIGI
jgi:hypothetical protein